MNNNTIPDWVYETLRSDYLRVYENLDGKVTISRVNKKHVERSMTPQAIIDCLRGTRKKPLVMHPDNPYIGRHVPKRHVIAVLSERV
jgi:hypothetical protein